MSKVARTLAVTEAITGLFYMAVLISRLVALHSRHQPVEAGGSEVTRRTNQACRLEEDPPSSWELVLTSPTAATRTPKPT